MTGCRTPPSPPAPCAPQPRRLSAPAYARCRRVIRPREEHRHVRIRIRTQTLLATCRRAPEIRWPPRASHLVLPPSPSFMHTRGMLQPCVRRIVLRPTALPFAHIRPSLRGSNTQACDPDAKAPRAHRSSHPRSPSRARTAASSGAWGTTPHSSSSSIRHSLTHAYARHRRVVRAAHDHRPARIRSTHANRPRSREDLRVLAAATKQDKVVETSNDPILAIQLLRERVLPDETTARSLLILSTLRTTFTSSARAAGVADHAVPDDEEAAGDDVRDPDAVSECALQEAWILPSLSGNPESLRRYGRRQHRLRSWVVSDEVVSSPAPAFWSALQENEHVLPLVAPAAYLPDIPPPAPDLVPAPTDRDLLDTIGPSSSTPSADPSAAATRLARKDEAPLAEWMTGPGAGWEAPGPEQRIVRSFIGCHYRTAPATPAGASLLPSASSASAAVVEKLALCVGM
ncbi:hypothetical protein DFH06DRAFT_1314153 [Mycena polygramma]|nr:hypothetical protein DFH06DRAFT_1314153 [Mycena polygramma]